MQFVVSEKFYFEWLVQFVVFEKNYKCLFIPNCTRKIYMKKYKIAPLTNREALNVHCSVVKHAGSGYSTKEV